MSDEPIVKVAKMADAQAMAITQARVDELVETYRRAGITPMIACNDFLLAYAYILAMQDLTDAELDELLPKTVDMIRLNFAAFQRAQSGTRQQ